MDIKNKKCDLRLEMRKKRLVAHVAAPDAALKLRDYFMADVFLDPCSVVAAYAAIGEEMNLFPLIESLVEKEHIVCLPIVGERNSPLVFRKYVPGDSLVQNRIKIPEPEDSQAELTPSVVLVPLLAFDRNGFRLGYGGGYYDCTLKVLREKNPSVRVFGIAFSEQEIASVPVEEHDMRLDGVVTEAGFIAAS
ncbi:MAG: 5-formyltetrahydrofolate cyclo-ligase [Alphaproteobacteria bacterium]|nr:5-formyltetrahydrofolate cyclo-ligase [Alphaproteobacteria bacterium]